MLTQRNVTVSKRLHGSRRNGLKTNFMETSWSNNNSRVKGKNILHVVQPLLGKTQVLCSA